MVQPKCLKGIGVIKNYQRRLYNKHERKNPITQNKYILSRTAKEILYIQLEWDNHRPKVGSIIELRPPIMYPEERVKINQNVTV